jgi:hypothetical protein
LLFCFVFQLALIGCAHSRIFPDTAEIKQDPAKSVNDLFEKKFVAIPQQLQNPVGPVAKNITNYRNPMPEFSIAGASDMPANASSLTNREIIVLVMFVLTAFGIIVFCIGYLVLKLIKNRAEEENELALDSMLHKHSSMFSSINNINSPNSSVYAKKIPPLKHLKYYNHNANVKEGGGPSQKACD